MSKINDGGPAFPSWLPTKACEGSAGLVEGMSLRDWFAGQALTGVISNKGTQ